jgi:hypothetical protein
MVYSSNFGGALTTVPSALHENMMYLLFKPLAQIVMVSLNIDIVSISAAVLSLHAHLALYDIACTYSNS